MNVLCKCIVQYHFFLPIFHVGSHRKPDDGDDVSVHGCDGDGGGGGHGGGGGGGGRGGRDGGGGDDDIQSELLSFAVVVDP